jgi:Tol biopolymer transport system component
MFLYDFELGGPTQLTFEGSNDSPVWSPDGSRIAFSSCCESRNRSDLYIMPVDGGSGAERLLTRPDWQHVDDWTEDGMIAFREVSNVSTDLWTMPADGGGEPEPFLIPEWAELGLAVSPDGQWAAYQSNETGRNEVYVRAFPSGAGQRRVTTRGGTAPRWSPDGETIYFLGGSTAADTIYAARVRLEPSFLVRETDAVYTARNVTGFDVHPDGTHLIAEVRHQVIDSTGDASDASSKVVVVLNWFEELRQRLEN